MNDQKKPEYEPPTISDLGALVELTEGNKSFSSPDNTLGIPIGS